MVIPEVANDGTNDYTVTEIDKGVFKGYEEMPSVVIGNSVSIIGEDAFYGCERLTSVIIPNSVITIEAGAFRSCSGLTSVIIPNSVTSIGSEAFAYCSDLKSVVIGNSVTSISWDAFYSCKSLNKSAYPNTLKDPFNYGLRFAYNPNGAIIEEGFVYGPEKSAIYFAPLSLEGEYVISESVTSIEKSAFLRCSELTSLVIPNSVTSIGNSAFFNCSGLTSVVIPNSVTEIEGSAFSFCRGLTSLVIPNSVTEIEDSAFKFCSLDTIVIGYGVKEIGSDAFYDNPASNIYITAQTPPIIESNTFSQYSGKLWLQGTEAVDAYDNAKYWESFNSEVMTVPTEIIINGPKEISGNGGDTYKLNATMSPAAVTLPYIMWRSTNPKIATVDNNGVVRLNTFESNVETRAEEGEEEGVCKIIAESLYFDGPIAEVTVYNTGIGIPSITLNESDMKLKVGESLSLTASVSNVEDKTVTWTSSDEAVAIVDAEGNVKVLKEGTCTITVSTTDGSDLKAECVITSMSGVETIFGEDAVVDVYDISGVLVKKTANREELKQLTNGLYILRCGNATLKIKY